MVLLIEEQAHIPHVYCVQAKQPSFLLLGTFQHRVGNLGGRLLIIKPVPESGNQMSDQKQDDAFQLNFEKNAGKQAGECR